MAIAYDNNSDSGVFAGVTSKTFSHTTGSLTNGILLVSVQTRDSSSTDAAVTGITYNGDALTKIRRDYTAGTSSELWYLVNPDTGANNVVVSFTGTCDTGTANAITFQGVDQTRPIADSNGSTSQTMNTSIDFGIYLDGAYIYDSYYTKWDGTVTVGASQTSVMTAEPNGGGDTSGASYKGGLSVGETTMSYSWDTFNEDTPHNGVVLRPSGEVSDTVDVIAVKSGRAGGTPLTLSITVPSGYTNRVLVVGTGVQDSNHANFPVTGITANGDALTKVRHDEPAGNVRSEIWYLINPDEGTYDITVTYTGAVGETSMSAVCFSGVDQTTPIEANNGASGSSATPSVSVTSTTDDAWFLSMTVAETWFQNLNHHTVTLPLIDQSYENSLGGLRPSKASAGARALSADLDSSQPYAISGVAIKPAATGTAVNSERDAKVTGKNTANAERDSKVTGKSTANAERGAKIIGKSAATATRSAKVTGKNTANAERGAKVTGKSTANDSRGAKVEGTYNFLIDGGIESNYWYNYWSEYNTTGTADHSRDTSVKRSGVASYKIVSTSGSNYDGGRTQGSSENARLGNLVAGEYRFSGWIKTGADVTNAHCIIRERTGFSVVAGGHVTTANQDWTKVEGTFTADGSTDYDVLIGLGSYGSSSAGTAYFDDLMLTPLYSSSRSAKVTGKASATDERDAKVTGKSTANAERDAKLSGKNTANASRSAKVTGKSTANAERSAKVVGKNTANSARSAKVTGTTVAGTSRSAKVVGKSTANAERGAKLTGALGANASRNAKITGVATTGDTRNAKVTGKLTTTGERSAKVIGKATSTNSRSAKVTGKLSTSAERDSKLTGKLSTSAERGAKISGKNTASASRSARLTGSTGVFEANNSRSATIVGTGDIFTDDPQNWYTADPQTPTTPDPQDWQTPDPQDWETGSVPNWKWKW